MNAAKVTLPRRWWAQIPIGEIVRISRSDCVKFDYGDAGISSMKNQVVWHESLETRELLVQVLVAEEAHEMDKFELKFTIKKNLYVIVFLYQKN